MLRHKLSYCAIALLPITFSPQSQASGQLPALETKAEFASFRACRDKLLSLHKAERAQAKRGMPSNDSTISHKVELLTDGVKRIAKHHAQYQSTLWFHHSAVQSDIQQVRTTHVYERHNRACLGKTFTETSQNGFTSETFEPIR